MIRLSSRALIRLCLAAGLTSLACAAAELVINPADPPALSQTPPTSAVPLTPAPSLDPPESPSVTSEPSATPTATATLTPGPTSTATPTIEIGYSSAAASVSFRIPLTLRHVTPDQAVLFFELQTPASGYLLYRPTSSSSADWQLQPLDQQTVRHQIDLQGLSPGTTYQVRVGLGSNPTELRAPWVFGSRWGDVTFETPESDSSDLRIGVIGDSGYGDRTTFDLAQLMATYRLDFVLHTGDLAYRTGEEGDPFKAYAKKYFLNLAPLLTSLPVYPVPGNHEYDRETYWEDRPFYFHAFSGVGIQGSADESWYSFARSGIQFLMLDSQVFHGARGRAAQTEWLIQRLAEEGYRFSIPVFHTPPFTSGLHTNDGAALAAEWLPRFEAAGVPLVISGHDHNYERIHFNGVTYLVSGGGSRVLYPRSEPVDGSQFFVTESHFVLLEITGDRITIEAIDLDERVRDRASIDVSSEG